MERTEVVVNKGRNDATLRSHWVKPLGPSGYYWFLTFENSPSLHSLVEESQRAIDFPHYHPVPGEALHLTLERIAGPGDVVAEDLRDVEVAARRRLSEIPPFDLHIGALRRVPSAIIFDIVPVIRVDELRSALRAATAEASAGAMVRTSGPGPHITLAYCNFDGPVPAKLDDAVAGINRSDYTVTTRVVDAVMVLLRRGRTSYSWDELVRVPLAGPE